MFDGLSPMDSMFIGAALALGFGVVKFMLVAKPGQKPAVSSVMPESTPAAQDEATAAGSKKFGEQVSAGGQWEIARIDDAPIELGQGPTGEKHTGGATWFELLDVPRTATEVEIEQAFAQKVSQFGPSRLQNIMLDLGFIAYGGLERSMHKQLQLQSLQAAVTAEQLKSMLGTLLNYMEAAREEGLLRRRQGKVD